MMSDEDDAFSVNLKETLLKRFYLLKWPGTVVLCRNSQKRLEVRNIKW